LDQPWPSIVNTSIQDLCVLPDKWYWLLNWLFSGRAGKLNAHGYMIMLSNQLVYQKVICTIKSNLFVTNSGINEKKKLFLRRKIEVNMLCIICTCRCTMAKHNQYTIYPVSLSLFSMIGPEHTRSFDTSEMLFYCWYSLTKKQSRWGKNRTDRLQYT
jgi:hypothetical protein